LILKLISQHNLQREIKVKIAMFQTVHWLAIDAADLAKTLDSFHLVLARLPKSSSFAE